MISQQLPIQATPAEAQILPKQLDKPTVARPSKAQLLSGTSDKPKVVEAEPLDLYGCQSHQVTCRIMHKYNRMADCRPLSLPISCRTWITFFGIFVPITIKRNLKAVLKRYSYIGPAWAKGQESKSSRGPGCQSHSKSKGKLLKRKANLVFIFAWWCSKDR